MIKAFLVGTLGVMLLVATTSFADQYSVCRENCSRDFSACTAAITATNDIEVQEAQASCDGAKVDCDDGCVQNRDAPPAVQEQKAPQEQQEQQKAPQEQPETINGNIKVYDFR